MRRILLLGICAWFISFATVFAQSTTYLKFDYIQVSEENSEAYLQLIDEVWQPLQQMRVDAGEIEEWHLYRVAYPGGEDGAYNYVMVTTVTNLKQLESDEGITSRISDREMQRTFSLRDREFSEIWKRENLVDSPSNGSKPARYVTMDYMDVAPGKDFDYMMLEDDVAKPIHRERIKQDQMRNWEVYSLVIPGGTEYGYNFATGNYFDELSHIEFGFTEEVVKQALPGTDLPELFNLIFDTRDMVKHELWELMDYAH